MSYRKVQKTSKGTYLISLPKEWATQNSLDKQEALMVTQGPDGSLIIKPPQARGKEIKVTLHMAPYISRHITWSYLMGADLVEVVGNGPISKEEKSAIKDAISRLAGFEIIDEKEDKITIGTLLEAGPGFIDKYLRKELFVATGMEREAVEAFVKGDAELAQGVKERDDEVDRLYFLLVRLTRGAIGNAHISERLEISPLLALDIREASEVLENLADYAVKVAGSVAPQQVLGPKEDVSIRTFIDEVADVQGRAIEALLSNAFQDVPSLLERRSKLSDLLKFEATGKGCDLMKTLAFQATMEQVLERTYDLVDLIVPKTIDAEVSHG